MVATKKGLLSEEKEAKRLLLLWAMGAIMPTPKPQSQKKFFAPLFFKKAAACLPCLSGAA
jgi:hypothetical protein